MHHSCRAALLQAELERIEIHNREGPVSSVLLCEGFRRKSFSWEDCRDAVREHHHEMYVSEHRGPESIYSGPEAWWLLSEGTLLITEGLRWTLEECGGAGGGRPLLPMRCSGWEPCWGSQGFAAKAGGGLCCQHILFIASSPCLTSPCTSASENGKKEATPDEETVQVV